MSFYQSSRSEKVKGNFSERFLEKRRRNEGREKENHKEMRKKTFSH